MAADFKQTVVITAPYFPPHGGGLERYAYEIGCRLHNNFKWRVAVITSGERYGSDEIEKINGLTVYRLAYRLKFSNTPFSFGWFGKIRRILKKENPDIINVHTPVPGIGDIAAFFANKAPLLVTYHAGSMHKGRPVPDLFVRLYESLFLKKLLGKADRIICSSNTVRFGFLRRYFNKSATVTPGVDTESFKPGAENTSGHPTVLFVGSLNKAARHKGLKILIDAIKILSNTIPDIRLAIVGGGDMKEDYQAYSKKLSLDKLTFFEGKLTGKELVSAYQNADLLVLPSLTPAESFPMVLIEAMACKKPVVGTNVGGIPEVIDNNKDGIIVPKNNPQALAAAIAQILKNKHLAQLMGANGFKKVTENLTWDKKVGQTEIILQQVLRNNLLDRDLI